MKWAWLVAHMGEGEYKVLLGKPEGMRPLEIPRCRQDDNIKMNFKEIVWQNMDWIHLAHVNMLMQGI